MQFKLPDVVAEPNLLIERYQFTEAMIFGQRTMEAQESPGP